MLEAERAELISRSGRYADRGLGVHADLLGAGGPVPGDLRDAPMIVDTDVGGDPDDAVALVAAAVSVPPLALVLTAAEVGGERARLARHLLDLTGRIEVPVVAGQEGVDPLFCVEGLVPDDVSYQPTDVVAAVARVCSGKGPVRWVGIGPLSNLAGVLAVRPDLAERFVLTQMGGAVRYRDPRRAEHNIRLDPAGAVAVLGALSRPYLVTSDVTFRPELEVTRDSPLYRDLAGRSAPAWGPLLRSHFDRWFERHHPGSMQHDALTLSAALDFPFVEFGLRMIVFDEIGRMSVAEAGISAFISRRAHYGPFHAWLGRLGSGLTEAGAR